MSLMNNFGKVALVKESWQTLKKNINLFVMMIGVYVIYYIAQYTSAAILRYNSLSSLVSFVFSVISLILELGSINLILKVIDGKNPQVKDMYKYPNRVMKVIKTFIASFLFGLMIVGGLILLVIPGIYLAIRFMFFSYYIVDKDAGIMDSLKMSWKLTNKAVINLFLFDLLIIFLNMLGAIAFGIGLLITVPISLISVTILYRKFQS
jgi:hypothetical protein